MASSKKYQRHILTVTLAIAGVSASVIVMKSCIPALYASLNKATRYLKKYEAEFEVKENQAVEIAKDFSEQLTVGLQREAGSSLKMIPSWLTALPTGKEKGEFFAIDIGGTNLRFLHCVFGTTLNQVLSHEHREIEIPQNRKKQTVKNLFDFVATTFVFFLQHIGKSWQGKKLKIGFCFSFPVKSEAPHVGYIQQLTKGYTFTDAIGKDAVQLLKDAFARATDVEVEIGIICNDAVGVLAAGKYADERTEIGVVLGTGTNASCLKPVSEIPKWVPGLPNDTLVPVNLEWGAFKSEQLPKTRFDNLLDSNSIYPGEYTFEKMISGESVGELCRLVLVALSHEGIWIKPSNLSQLVEPNSLTSAMVSDICSDTSPDYTTSNAALRTTLNLIMTHKEMARVRQVCDIITDRAIMLISAAMAATIAHVHNHRSTSANSVVVAIDGSMYIKFEKMRRGMQRETQRILNLLLGSNTTKFELMPYQGGSAFGAAALAAAVIVPDTESVTSVQFPEIDHLDQ